MKVIEHGNIFASQCEAICIPVNCKGVMGAGLAKKAHVQWPDRCASYFEKCRMNAMRPGSILVDEVKGARPRLLLFVSTKDHWNDASQLAWIEIAAARLVKTIELCKVKSLAIPALGAGLGGLGWPEVLDILHKHLDDSAIRIEVYAPHVREAVHARAAHKGR